jgi:hypothetical protein
MNYIYILYNIYIYKYLDIKNYDIYFICINQSFHITLTKILGFTWSDPTVGIVGSLAI